MNAEMSDAIIVIAEQAIKQAEQKTGQELARTEQEKQKTHQEAQRTDQSKYLTQRSTHKETQTTLRYFGIGGAVIVVGGIVAAVDPAHVGAFLEAMSAIFGVSVTINKIIVNIWSRKSPSKDDEA